MLAASLLLSLQTPTSLDKAFERASEALRAHPDFTCVYNIESKDDVNGTFSFWRSGDRQKFEIESGGDLWLRGFKLNDRVLFILPTQKQYLDSNDAALWEKTNSAPTALEEGKWQFTFTQTLDLKLKSNPPFRVTSQGLVSRRGKTVRVIHVQTNPKGNEGQLTGTVEFDEESKLFTGAHLQESGSSEETYIIKRKVFTLSKPAEKTFAIDSKQYEGYEKIISGSEQ